MYNTFTYNAVAFNSLLMTVFAPEVDVTPSLDTIMLSTSDQATTIVLSDDSVITLTSGDKVITLT
jgi:hypothetical protein